MKKKTKHPKKHLAISGYGPAGRVSGPGCLPYPPPVSSSPLAPSLALPAHLVAQSPYILRDRASKAHGSGSSGVSTVQGSRRTPPGPRRPSDCPSCRSAVRTRSTGRATARLSLLGPFGRLALLFLFLSLGLLSIHSYEYYSSCITQSLGSPAYACLLASTTVHRPRLFDPVRTGIINLSPQSRPIHRRCRRPRSRFLWNPCRSGCCYSPQPERPRHPPAAPASPAHPSP